MRNSGFALCLGVALSGLASVSATAQAETCRKAFRPPAVPLVSVEPFFSLWSAADRLYDVDTSFWAGGRQQLAIVLDADGASYRLCGRDDTNGLSTFALPVLPQRALEVGATTTRYRFGDGKITAELEFMTPRLTDDLDVFSRPVTYVTCRVTGAKQAAIRVAVEDMIAANRRVDMVREKLTVAGLDAVKIGCREQTAFSHHGDALQAPWGYVYLVGPSRMADGCCHFLLAYDSVKSVRYFGHDLVDWWRRGGKDFPTMLVEAERDYAPLRARAREFDRRFAADMRAVGGDEYADIAALAWRQSFAACKFVASPDGEMFLMSNESGSGGMIGTTDVFYPQFPHLLLSSLDLAKASLAPTCVYAASDKWPYDYAPHDLGWFPVAEGQVYRAQDPNDHAGRMPVEECGNMLICLGAVAKAEGNAAFASRWWGEVEKWAAYLEKVGFDPENQLCTDDFAGHLAHNANLSIKSAMGLASYAMMAEMRGEKDVASKFRALAADMAKRWQEAAKGGACGGYRLAFDRPDTWSLKYNLVWDRLLGFNLFPPSVAEAEMQAYRALAKDYAIGLDSRSDFAKADWEIWAGSLTGKPEDLEFAVSRLWRYLNETPSRAPFNDWYFASSGLKRSFQARSVVGAVFLPVLQRPEIAAKYLDGGRPKRKAVAGDYPIRSADLRKVQVTGGLWASRIETNRLVTLKTDFAKCEETPRINNFRNAAKRNYGTFGGIPYDDSDVYKVMEGAAYVLATSPDPELEKYMTDLIATIAKAQEDDGYLYTARTLKLDYVPMLGKTPFSNTMWSHELYNIGHMYEAAVAWYETTGRRDFLDVAVKSADLVDRTFGPGERQNHSVSGHEEIELALVKLYRTTGEKRYLKLAKHLIDYRGGPGVDKKTVLKFSQDGDLVAGSEIAEPGSYSQNHRPAAEQREAVGHAVRAAYLYCGMADVAALTGEQSYRTAIDSIWEDVVGAKMHLTGGIGARGNGEAFGLKYELPNGSAYLETCAAVGNALWNDRMFRFTGDAKYVDVLERVIYNGFLSGVSIGGDEFFYPNPLTSTGGYARQKWFKCSCCPVNVVRFIPQVPRFAYATDGKGTIWWNLFIDSKAEIGGVRLRQRTDYPWDGTSELTVGTDGEFALKLRIPGWARGVPVPGGLYVQADPSSADDVRLAVNGSPVPTLVGTDGYVTLRRGWRKGDSVKVTFPMPVRRMLADPRVEADRNRVALERGPIVYCAEEADNGAGVLKMHLSDAARFSDGRVSIAGQTFPSVVAQDGDSRIVFIPYFSWCHRGAGRMQTWMPVSDEAFVNAAGIVTDASHCCHSDSTDAAFDGKLPSSSSDTSIPRFTWWGKFGSEEWISFKYREPRTLQGLEVYWYDDSAARGGCRPPTAWRVEALSDDGRWQAVPGTYPIVKDAFSKGAFGQPVTAKAFRVVAKLPENLSSGILECRALAGEAK